MYQEHREEVLCVRNTGKRSYVSGIQGKGLMCQEHIEGVTDIRILFLSAE